MPLLNYVIKKNLFLHEGKIQNFPVFLEKNYEKLGNSSLHIKHVNVSSKKNKVDEINIIKMVPNISELVEKKKAIFEHIDYYPVVKIC